MGQDANSIKSVVANTAGKTAFRMGDLGISLKGASTYSPLETDNKRAAPTFSERLSSARCGLAEVLFQEREDLGPPVHRLLLPVGGAIVIEEAVAGRIVAMELVILPVPLQLFLVLVHLLG